MELLAGDKLGKYEVVGRLAAGGMAEVYLARSLGHAGFSKYVALKRMLPDLASEPGFREMFMQEASVAARLNHPNIVQIFDFAEERGELYLAMEYVHGVNLKRLNADSLSQRTNHPELRLSPVLAAHICRCIARALAHAWQVPDEQGRASHLIHRDVSPHNILVSYEGDAKLADFGIAKPAERRTSVGVLKGKLLYMAPEQLLGGVLDARTDVFALGIVLYEAAMGLRKPLFDAGNEGAVKQALQSRLVVPPERMDPDFPKSLSSVVMKTLERDPERRFQSAAELSEALGEVIHREASCSLDYDIASYMRRIYGEPPPVRGSRPGIAEEASREVAAPLRSELDRRADDPFAPTVLRSQADALRATPAAAGEGGTRAERRAAPLVEGPAGPVDAGAPSAPRGPGTSGGLRRRWLIGLAAGGVLGCLALAGAFVRTRGATDSPQLSTPMRVEVPSISAETMPGSIVALPSISPDGGIPSVLAGEVPGDGARGGALQPGGPAPAAVGERSDGPSPDAGEQGTRDLQLIARKERAPASPGTERKGAAERRRIGTLVVHAKPWAFVWVDGEAFTGKRDQEAAPLLKRSLLAGRHVVHVQDPAGHTRSIPVVVPADREVRVEETFVLAP